MQPYGRRWQDRAAAPASGGRGRCAARGAAAGFALALLGACAAREAAAPAPVAYETGAASCSARADARFARPLGPRGVDPALVDRAIRFYTNRERCKAGLAPLDPAPALAEAAAMQSADMAAAARVAPVLPARPDRTLARRYVLAGVGPYAQRGENLMRIALETPGVARVRSAAPECAFATAGPDRALSPTYGSVARRLVDAWMRSEALRANILSPDWTNLGGGLAIRPAEGSCGEVYSAQSFVKA